MKVPAVHSAHTPPSSPVYPAQTFAHKPASVASTPGASFRFVDWTCDHPFQAHLQRCCSARHARSYQGLFLSLSSLSLTHTHTHARALSLSPSLSLLPGSQMHEVGQELAGREKEKFWHGSHAVFLPPGRQCCLSVGVSAAAQGSLAALTVPVTAHTACSCHAGYSK